MEKIKTLNRRVRSQQYKVATVATAAALIVAGCSGGKGDQDSDEGSQQSTSSAPETTSPTEADNVCRFVAHQTAEGDPSVAQENRNPASWPTFVAVQVDGITPEDDVDLRTAFNNFDGTAEQSAESPNPTAPHIMRRGHGALEVIAIVSLVGVEDGAPACDQFVNRLSAIFATSQPGQAEPVGAVHPDFSGLGSGDIPYPLPPPSSPTVSAP